MAGNIVAGGVIGMVVDGTSGAMNDLLPNPMDVTLEATTTAQTGQPAAAAETKTAAQ